MSKKECCYNCKYYIQVAFDREYPEDFCRKIDDWINPYGICNYYNEY